MTIIILAGGISKRMWPIGQDKLTFSFLDKPLFYYVLTELKRGIEIENLIIVTNNSNQQSLIEIAKGLNLNTKFLVQPEAWGMADAILSARNEIKGEIMVINGDDLLDAKAYELVLEKARQSNYDAIFAGLKVDKYFPGGYLVLEGDKVKGVVEKPGDGNEPSNLVKLVVDYFRDGQKLVEILENTKSDKDDIYEVGLDSLVKSQASIGFIEYSGIFKPLKYPWHVLDLTEYFLQDLKGDIHPSVKIAKSAVIEGAVVLSEGVKVFEGAVIKGPVFIGRNTIIGGNALVRDSIIGENCVVGAGSEVARSYVGAASWFHTNYIGDSVIEGDFGMGSGAVLANLRLDGKTVKVGREQIDTRREKLGLMVGRGVRIGVNASTMPGVRIGSGSLIGPGVILTKDVKEKTKLLLTQSYTEERNEAIVEYEEFKDRLKS